MIVVRSLLTVVRHKCVYSNNKFLSHRAKKNYLLDKTKLNNDLENEKLYMKNFFLLSQFLIDLFDMKEC